MRFPMAVLLGALAAAAVCGADPGSTALTYPGAGPDLPVSFVYPADWRLTEELGGSEAYHAARLQGPRNTDNTYTAYLVVRAFPVQPPGSRYADQRAMLNHVLTTLPDGARVVQQATRPVGGGAADDLTFTHTIPPLHHAKRNAVKIPVKTRTLVVAHGALLYELTYSADERDYDTHLAAFDALLASLQFASP